MGFSFKATAYTDQSSTGSKNVEVYRRYPAPEMVQLPVKATATASTAGAAVPPLSSSSVCSSAESAEVTDGSATGVTLRLRWGVQAEDLRRVYEMHENAYPISYTAAYYEWLLDHDACLGLVALATQDKYRERLGRWREAKDNAPEAEAATAASSLCSPPSVAIAQPVPPPASQCRPTAEVLQERAEVQSIITEQECIAARKGANQHHMDNMRVSGNEGSDAAAHTVVVGFIIGQIAYARHDAGHLLSNPTAYIGSFAVDPPFQCCGVGHALLQRFITYATQQRPMYAQDYLHYDERKLIALLAGAQIKKRTAGVEALLKGASAAAAGGAPEDGGGDSLYVADARSDALTPLPLPSPDAPSPLSSAAPTRPSLLQSLFSTFLPELQGWREDRQARLRLRRCGLTEEDIDAQRFRDRLDPDALTDEEADEVRRDARHFVVQTGVRDVWLHCLPGNITAIRFYARRGFRLRRVLKAYYNISGAPYDAHLLHYVCENDEPASVPAAPAEHSSAGATDSLKEVDHEEKRWGCRAAATEEAATGFHGVASLAAAAPASCLPPPPPSAGLRRRRGAPPVGEDGGLATSDSVLTEGGRAFAPAHSTATPAAAADALAEKTTGLTEASAQMASWLSPRTYPAVADIILCTAERGQEEWRRRSGSKGSGDVRGRRPGWWEKMREVIFAANAVGLLCVVLWLAYNLAVTGKVE
ncbi:hypothetical protein CUR178_07089 [Leishmania enriettii]|uniref:N-alpha-acetyltransferase 60 n=1 Tax=Leishmania enriettii TaxID=5663 RepID=A0A836HPF2_LEIEN|nr:hypothetical protein CUR178_07089 [Leishmania enriettii]